MIKLKLIPNYKLKHGNIFSYISTDTKYVLVIESNGSVFETDITSNMYSNLSITMTHEKTTADFELSSGEKFENICVVGE